MDYFLQKVGGRPARQTVTLRRCTPAEAPAVFALQNEVRAAMPVSYTHLTLPTT